ncbi:membrane protein FxsA [Shewanella sp. AS1]|uniref:FxsA family protein n=1 Tax=Shewanella sp. AS1 TaxID=2907626 RepID=UPI001F28DD16|nr:FxsA family protein [Shewanella sp. AS1]MCE9679273.1 membrane protein FxsA [Shewanella sp. AS1]
MFFILLMIFVLVPVIELNVLIRVGENIGSWNTVGLVILTAVVGVSLVRSQGISTLLQVQQKLARGEAPGQEIVEGMMLAMAGLLLLIPGFVTDFIGLLLLTPLTRKPVVKLLYKKMQVRVSRQGGFQAGFGPGFHQQHQQSPFEKDSSKGHTIDGDYEHKDDKDNKETDSRRLDDSSHFDDKNK